MKSPTCILFIGLQKVAASEVEIRQLFINGLEPAPERQGEVEHLQTTILAVRLGVILIFSLITSDWIKFILTTTMFCPDPLLAINSSPSPSKCSPSKLPSKLAPPPTPPSGWPSCPAPPSSHPHHRGGGQGDSEADGSNVLH